MKKKGIFFLMIGDILTNVKKPVHVYTFIFFSLKTFLSHILHVEYMYFIQFLKPFYKRFTPNSTKEHL